jgi:hypothetical protein
MLLAQVKDPRVLSDVSEKEIIHCASLFVVANKMKDTMLADFLQAFLMLRVSKQRKGREELLQIARSAKDSSEGRVSRLKTFLTGMR